MFPYHVHDFCPCDFSWYIVLIKYVMECHLDNSIECKYSKLLLYNQYEISVIAIH